METNSESGIPGTLVIFGALLLGFGAGYLIGEYVSYLRYEKEKTSPKEKERVVPSKPELEALVKKYQGSESTDYRERVLSEIETNLAEENKEAGDWDLVPEKEDANESGFEYIGPERLHEFGYQIVPLSYFKDMKKLVYVYGEDRKNLFGKKNKLIGNALNMFGENDCEPDQSIVVNHDTKTIYDIYLETEEEE